LKYKILEEGELEAFFNRVLRQALRPEALLHRRYFLNSGTVSTGPLDGSDLSLSIASMVEKGEINIPVRANSAKPTEHFVIKNKSCGWHRI